jgi:hypothetical protein
MGRKIIHKKHDLPMNHLFIEPSKPLFKDFANHPCFCIKSPLKIKVVDVDMSSGKSPGSFSRSNKLGHQFLRTIGVTTK